MWFTTKNNFDKKLEMMQKRDGSTNRARSLVKGNK